MRSLSRNKTKIWRVHVLEYVDEVDGDGFKTGEVVSTYGEPEVIWITLYPTDGLIARQSFGITSSFDMVSVTNDVVLLESDLLFLEEPVSDYDVTFDYEVSKANESLNSYSYGLKKRV